MSESSSRTVAAGTGRGDPPGRRGNRPDTLFDPDTRIGRDLAAVDWAATPLGPVGTWQGSLRNVVRLMLSSRFAMWMAWGPGLTFLCNDAYRLNTLGTKYPWALGRPASEVWEEIWPDIGPLIDSVIGEGTATWSEDLLLFLERSGYPEETYHTFSYSPITDDDGVIAGMLCVVSEETARVISERRMRVVRDLSSALAVAGTQAEVFSAATGQLSAGGRSVPFAVGYLFDEDGTAERVLAAGVPAGHRLAPAIIRADDPDAAWPVTAAATGHVDLVDDLVGRFGPDLPTGAWGEAPKQAMVVPFLQPGADRAFGFLAVGLNRYRVLDADYRGFVQLLAGQLGAAITRARAYEEERRRAEDLAELDRAKTLFFTNVSHELRTPLTLLLGPAADALDDRDEPLSPRQRSRMEVVERNAERLLKLVNTLLDFSRMQSGTAQGSFEPVDLAAWTAELATMFDSAVRRAGLTFEVDCPPLPALVHVDREMWAKIVLNLLSNALKATFEGGITVRLAAVGDSVELSVTDTGVGIPDTEQDKLFARFHRVAGTRLRSHEGSGIGLALVAELAAIHGGRVGVRSTPGSGSTFTVEIPTGTSHLPADRLVTNAAADRAGSADARALGVGYLAEADRWLGGDAAGGTGAADTTAPDADGAPAPARQHVLVADDNADMRAYVSGLLAPHYSVEVAVDGNDALHRARRRPPDLVLTDVMMPGLDGFGLLEALRSDPATVHVPVVMLSARSGDEAAVVGLEAGADDYLVKPFSTRELLARVRANLELDRIRRVRWQLERHRELLDQAEELAHVGSWQLDLDDGSLAVSPELARILGREQDGIAAGGIEGSMLFVDPADRPALAEALTALRKEGVPLDREFHVTRPDGERRLVRAIAVLRRDAEGTATVVRGSMQDITEQRAAEQAVGASRAAQEAAAREHAIAAELQRNLLPARTPRNDSLDIAAYYLAGVEDTQAGGDWYDVIELPGGRTAVVIGDVMGRGVRAAAVMGQLRAMTRAYARLDLPVDTLLQQLDAEVAATTDGTIVTCVYAVIDPASGTLTYGTAGHVPPLLRHNDGTVTRLAAGDPPLGTGRYTGSIETVQWTPGMRLVLYTDGLVEHRGDDLDANIDRLAGLLAEAHVVVEALPTTLVDAMLPSRPGDDVAVLAVAARTPGSRDVAVAVAPVDTSVAQARHLVAAALAEWGIRRDLAGDVVLVVSELVTNTLRYGAAPIELRMRWDAGTSGSVVVDVSDAAVGRPELRAMTPDAANGRGLHLVAALCSAWGSRPTGNGKSVWCVFTPRPQDG